MSLLQKENGNVCLFGMKGFKAGSTNNAQETKERRQLVLATSLCFVFMVKKEIIIIMKICIFFLNSVYFLLCLLTHKKCTPVHN